MSVLHISEQRIYEFVVDLILLCTINDDRHLMFFSQNPQSRRSKNRHITKNSMVTHTF